ncbi:MAG TPA: GNAT family N-acetyltransferase [Streptosporangiaceae bacterium]|nr:GNAT family N-acetyltransferase [Streptosporangiaceae bacterium]
MTDVGDGACLRVITDDELEACERLKAEVFGLAFTAERMDDVRRVREVDRTFAVFEGARLVATLSALTHTLTVPGGQVAACGVTGLAVKRSRAQTGLEDRLFVAELRAAKDRGEPVAALCALADLSVDYTRYGFGVASYGTDLILRSPWPGLACEPDVEVTTVHRDDALPAVQSVYDALRAVLPGAVDRSPGQWLRWEDRLRAYPLVVARAEGRPVGYMVARPEPADDGDRVYLAEFLATTPAAYHALARHMLTSGEVAEIRAEHRPVHEPLLWRLPIRLRSQRTATDGIWVRLVDVAAALSARRYQRKVSVTLAVSDDLLAENHRTFKLESDGSDASCVPSTSTPEVRVTVGALGAAYLGGVPLSALAAAGLIDATPGALERLDAAFASSVAPWAVTRF